MKKGISILLAAFLLFGVMTVNQDMMPNVSAATKKYGLTVDSNGTIRLDGKPFYAFGTNLYDAFQRNLSNPLDATYQQSFALVKKYNIPFVRIPFSGYQENAYDLYDQDKEAYFAFMDQIVDEAEKQHVGIIASLMWWDPALSAHVGEKRSDMGKTNSKTMKYAKQYVADIVKRYVNRPGIWGWEIGNEYNLGADLCDRSFQNYLWAGASNTNGYDYYTSAELRTFYSEIAKEIRKYDNYRMITSGNGDMRGASKAMNKASAKMDKNHLWDVDWTSDTLSDFYEMNAYYHPDPMDTFCFHLQHGTLNGNPPRYDLNIVRWNRTITQKEYYQEYANAAKRAKKGLFFGEFGDFMDMEDDKDMYKQFTKVMTDIRDAGIQLAATWQFYFDGDGQVVSDKGKDGYKLSEISRFNLEYQKSGKQDTSKAWTDVKPNNGSSSNTPPGNKTSSTDNTTPPSPTTSNNVGSTSEISSISEVQAAVDSYMKTSSTKLVIDADQMAIIIDKPVSLDVFQRSIALRDGYQLQVKDANGILLSDAAAVVDATCTVAVFDPTGAEISSFTIMLKETDSSSDTAVINSAPDQKKGLGAGWIVLIVVLSLAVLGGGGFALYYFVLREKFFKK